jgi:hypothetical protein
MEEIKPKRELYQVIEVEQVTAPRGMSGPWHRYVIKRGKTTIEGMHAGGLETVTEHAREYTETINARLTKVSYGHGSASKKK